MKKSKNKRLDSKQDTATAPAIAGAVFVQLAPVRQLEFGGESPLTIRARCGCIRYFPDPLGFVSAEVFVKLELV